MRVFFQRPFRLAACGVIKDAGGDRQDGRIWGRLRLRRFREANRNGAVWGWHGDYTHDYNSNGLASVSPTMESKSLAFRVMSVR
jgi:hypothetical protein